MQAEYIKRQLTPRKCDNTDSDSDMWSNVSSISAQDSDWLIPELSRSRSVPSSPVIGSVSHMTSSPRISSNQERYFRFLPDRIRDLEAVRLSPDDRRSTINDEVDHDCRSPHILDKSHLGKFRQWICSGRLHAIWFWRHFNEFNVQLIRDCDSIWV